MMDRTGTDSLSASEFFQARSYEHPDEVLQDQCLSTGEKRALLASWASDAYAVPSQPHLRRLPGSHRVISIDTIFAALSALDHPPRPPGGKPARVKSTLRLETLPVAA